MNIDASVNHSDANAALTFVSKQQTPHQAEPVNMLDVEGGPKALLPRGFGVMWQDIREDHHFNRLAFKYGDLSRIDSEDESGFDLFWQLESIYKDKSFDRNFNSAEILSLVSGRSIELVIPRFNIELGQSRGSVGYKDIVTRTVEVDNLRFDYAVPVLNGWDIGIDSNSDSHLQEIGVWIDSFNYEKAPGSVSGKLTYVIKSVFHDKKPNEAKEPRYQVNILGVNSRGISVSVPSTPSQTIDPSGAGSGSGSGSGSGAGTTSSSGSTSTGTRSNSRNVPTRPVLPRGKPGRMILR